jgi:protein-tyrosine kinase
LSTIEQAAKRLEQLRQAGVDLGTAAGSTPPLAEPGPPHESVPLRVARELEAHGGTGTAAPRARRPEPAVAPVQHRPQTRVEIDLARLSANGYVTPAAARSRLAEEFRVIKRPLLTNARGKSAASIAHANRIMITSALPGEGKTYVSLNLAMSIAMELDTSVMLVDADASRPAVLERLGLQPSRGLFDLLADPALTLDECVLATNVERLSILPAWSNICRPTIRAALCCSTRLRCSPRPKHACWRRTWGR